LPVSDAVKQFLSKKKLPEMKKFYILFLVLFISNEILAQDKLLGILPLKDGKVTYSDIVQLQGVPKDEIYNRVKHWFINTYNSGKDVIQLDDRENGEIIGKGCFRALWVIRFYSAQSVNVWKTIKIQIKNDRLRYEITDFRLKYYYLPSQNASITDTGIPLEDWNKGHDSNNKRFYPKINNQIDELIKSLVNAMKTNISDSW
jgi:hypothetical protein